ncbi:SpoIIE family protein phosphatase [Nocardioides sp. SYSU DS0663]|uniref:SpoIIE family protein phosphatase n=1 Tax=Nocardioides sp. SYSU DS0663 TaxID=3416445 RepID=UPI003F4B6947
MDRGLAEVLRSSGRLGRDLLAVDWRATPLGPVEDWPLSLTTVVRTMVTSRFSMWMAWGPELTFLCNDAYRRDTLGAKYPEALGRPTREVWPEVWPSIGPRIEQVMRTGEATWDEKLLLFLERSGFVEETYHTFSYSPLADDDGTTSGMLCVVTEDTEEVVFERRMTTLRDLAVRERAPLTEAAAVATACERLARNRHSLPFVEVYLFADDGLEAHLQGVAGIAPGHPAAPPVVAVDAADGPWPLNAAAEGRTALVDAVDERFSDLPATPWERPPRQAFVLPLLQPGQPRPYGALVVGLNRHRPFDDGYRTFLELVAAHLSTAIGDARSVEQERRRASDLARIDQLKSDFIANVSHELRTPLTLLLGPAEDALTDDDHPLPDAQRRRVEVIARNGRRMRQLVNTLLDFSRLEAGQDAALYVPTDLCAYTAELTAMVESTAERAGLALEVECEGGATAYVDREHWAKIVLNLLTNALKFTIEGSVRVGLHDDGTHAVLTVSDTGPGIPEVELPRLFERFHRVAGMRSRTHEGTGLGLALVHELVEQHGGHVQVTTSSGGTDHGTTFTVTIPLRADHLPAERIGGDDPRDTEATGDLVRSMARALADESSYWLPDHPVLSTPSAPSAAEPAPAAEGRPQVLVVDDNADMRRHIADLLAQAYDVRSAVDGLDALRQMAVAVPDLVLTDVMMPELDGFGLLRRMQADPALMSVPVIMLSARAGEEGTVEGLEAGAVDYLVKPFSSRELLARVRVNLALDRAQRLRDALERSSALLDQAQRLARLGSWEIDLADLSLTGSATFLEMTGLTAVDLDRRAAADLLESLVHPDDLPGVLAKLSEAAGGKTVEHELRIVLPSGDTRLFHAYGEPARGADGSRLLRGSFQDVTEQRALQEQLVAAEAEREMAEQERRIAHDLQESLLPRTDPHVPALDVATYYRAGVVGTEVGGDWYDVIDLGAGRTAVVIGDVMGRGVRAAAVMGQLRAATRAFAKLDLPCTDVLEQLDPLVHDLAGDQIVTCVYAVVDAADLHLTYANAGHLPPLLARAGGAVEPLEAVGPPLGAGFYGQEATTVSLHADDVLLLYTDGLVERRGEDLQEGIGRLVATLARFADRPVAELLDKVVAGSHAEEVDDDVALVAARARAEVGGAVVRLRVGGGPTAVRDVRRAVAAQVAAWGAPAERVDDAKLVISELVTNALIHARPPVDVHLRRLEDAVLMEVWDPALLRPRRRRTGGADEHGRGLGIVAALARDWGSRPSEAGKTVWALLDWPATDS